LCGFASDLSFPLTKNTIIMNRKNTWKSFGAALALMLVLGTSCNSGNSNSGNSNSGNDKTDALVQEQTEVTQEELEGLAKALPKYNVVSNFHEGLAVVCNRETDLYGFIDKKGNEVIPCQYRYISCDFNDGVAIVTKDNDQEFIIDKTGKEIAKYDYGYHQGFKEGLLAFGTTNEESGMDMEGYLDTNGKVVIAPTYEMGYCNGPFITDFSEGLCKRYDREANKSFFIDKTGKKVFECKGSAEDFHEGLASVARDLSDKEDEWKLRTGFIDKKGAEVIPFIFNRTGQFCDGLCWAETDDAIGFINREGKFVITGDYKTIILEEGMECGESPLCPTFSEGLAWVSNKDGKFGYIDKTGKVVVPFRYEPWVEDDMFLQGPCYNFHGGLARVWDKNTQKYGYIDKTGKEVFPCRFDEAEDISEGIAVVGIDAHYGFIDAKGHCTLDMNK